MHSLAQLTDPADWAAMLGRGWSEAGSPEFWVAVAQDHLDQHPALRRQRRGHRAGLPRPAAAPAGLGHDPRRRRRGGAAHRLHRRRRLADAAAVSQNRRRPGAALHRRQAAGAGRAGPRRDRGGRAPVARGAHRRGRRHHHEPRQRHRHRRGGRRQCGAAGARPCHQHPADRGRGGADHGAARPLPAAGVGGRRPARLDRRRRHRHRPGFGGIRHRPLRAGGGAERSNMARPRPARCWCWRRVPCGGAPNSRRRATSSEFGYNWRP